MEIPYQIFNGVMVLRQRKYKIKGDTTYFSGINDESTLQSIS